jgi:uncharacterized protein
VRSRAAPGGMPGPGGIVGRVSSNDDLRRFRGLARVSVAGRTVPVATSLRSRLLGLAVVSPRRAGEGVLIPGCRSVHTFGMRFSLHVVFLDSGMAPISIRGSVPRGRVVGDRRAAAVIELPVRRAPAASGRN